MKKISDFNSATEKYTVVYAGSATRPEYVDMPTILQQQEGVAPMDTLPAQWWNAMWKLATKDINAFRDYVGDAFTEINNLLTKFNITLDDADTEQLYDFFHDDYVQDYLSTLFLSKSGGTIDGNLHVKGDLSVDGIGEEVISTELKVGANTITLRNDNPSSLGDTELAGIVTENYDGNNHNNIIAINKNGEARTGDIDIATRILYSSDGTNFFTDEELTTPAVIGADEEIRDTGNQTSGGVEIYEGITYSNDDTEPLLTRDESANLSSGSYLKWDSANKRAIAGLTIPDPTVNNTMLKATINGGNVGLEWATVSSSSSFISAPSTTITGMELSNGEIIRIMFTADILGTDTVTGMTITYNGTPYNVMVGKQGTLSAVKAHEVSTDIYKYIQAYTTLDLLFDGTQFIISGNPVVLSSANYTIHADSSAGDEPVGTIKAYYSTNTPYGYLVCDGSTFDETVYTNLYTLLGTNTVPDLRECVLVGIGTNNSNSMATHDVYTLGQFKDDQFQNHSHTVPLESGGMESGIYYINAGNSSAPYIHHVYDLGTSSANGRAGSTTHGKQKGVNYIIKAL